MAYVRGNLALQEKRAERKATPTRYKETTKIVTKKANLSGKEKLLYIVSVLLCVLIAGMILARYADIYKNSMDIQNMDQQTKAMQKEILLMQNEVDTKSSPDAIRTWALANGYEPVQQENEINTTTTTNHE